MKPRTKRQIQVMELTGRLHDIKNKLLPWAKTHCLEHKGYATKSRIICMDCGERFSGSLIFSARVGGVKIETVEVSLKRMKVVQSRGKCNQNTKYHDRILRLVNRNMNLIRQKTACAK